MRSGSNLLAMVNFANLYGSKSIHQDTDHKCYVVYVPFTKVLFGVLDFDPQPFGVREEHRYGALNLPKPVSFTSVEANLNACLEATRPWPPFCSKPKEGGCDSSAFSFAFVTARWPTYPKKLLPHDRGSQHYGEQQGDTAAKWAQGIAGTNGGARILTPRKVLLSSRKAWFDPETSSASHLQPTCSKPASCGFGVFVAGTKLQIAPTLQSDL